jgi:hypothetical protein
MRTDQPSAMREKFEKLAGNKGYGTGKDDGPSDLRIEGDDYVNPWVQITWRGFVLGYQAAQLSEAKIEELARKLKLADAALIKLKETRALLREALGRKK